VVMTKLNPARVSARTSADEPSSRALLPEWLPQPVADYALRTFTNERLAAPDELLLGRLSSDLRMKRVWNELLKRKRFKHRSTEAFKYPTTSLKNWTSRVRAGRRRAQNLRRMSDPINEAEAKKVELCVATDELGQEHTWGGGEKLPTQQLALVAFFDQAFKCARSNSRPVSRADAQAKRAHYLDMARRIRDDVARLDIRSITLIDAAFEYEALADWAAPPPDDPLLVARTGRGDERQRGFVIELVTSAAAIFGSPLYGIVAIVTNVVFERKDWTGQRVRKIAERALPLSS
jgi:hypothetical protein